MIKILGFKVSFFVYFFLITSPNLDQDFEASFLRLLDKITNGSLIEINETGLYLVLSSIITCFTDYYS